MKALQPVCLCCGDLESALNTVFWGERRDGRCLRHSNTTEYVYSKIYLIDVHIKNISLIIMNKFVDASFLIRMYSRSRKYPATSATSQFDTSDKDIWKVSEWRIWWYPWLNQREAVLKISFQIKTVYPCDIYIYETSRFQTLLTLCHLTHCGDLRVAGYFIERLYVLSWVGAFLHPSLPRQNVSVVMNGQLNKSFLLCLPIIYLLYLLPLLFDSFWSRGQMSTRATIWHLLSLSTVFRNMRRGYYWFSTHLMPTVMVCIQH